MARSWPKKALRMEQADWDRLARRAKTAGMTEHGYAVAILREAGTLLDPLKTLREAQGDPAPAHDVGF